MKKLDKETLKEQQEKSIKIANAFGWKVIDIVQPSGRKLYSFIAPDNETWAYDFYQDPDAMWTILNQFSDDSDHIVSYAAWEAFDEWWCDEILYEEPFADFMRLVLDKIIEILESEGVIVDVEESKMGELKTTYYVRMVNPLTDTATPWEEVSEEDFVRAERMAGFTGGSTPMTAGFSDGTLEGRVKYTREPVK